jgi:signal transduction histidine kinase/DNA-binding response OmpR family regulator
MNTVKRRAATPDQDRILVLAPVGGDAALSRTLLTEAGFGCRICTDVAELCNTFTEGVGAVLLTEEAFTVERDLNCLVELIHGQPTWSDVPIVLLTDRGADSPAALAAMELLGNVIVLERPVRITTLVSVLRTALKARRRQYELRDHIETLNESIADRVRATDELRKQSYRLRMLWESASVLLATDDPEQMLRGLFEKIAHDLGVDLYFNFMVNESGDGLTLESCMGIPEDDARRIRRMEFGQAICGNVALRREPIVATFIQASNDPMVQLVKQYGVRCYACNPLLAEDRLLGTLSFASRTRNRFSAEELEFLRTICEYVTIAYERVRLVKQLRESDRHKDEFLATLAHELRNPLAPIVNGMQVMRLSADDPVATAKMLEIVERQVGQMIRLIDDLLDVNRIGHGKIQLQKRPVDLAEVAAAAVETSKPLIESRRHELTVTLPPQRIVVEADSARLAQILANLLNNAAKYTEPGGRISLVGERQGSDVVLTVEDTGIGIAPSMLPRVFDMFAQSERTIARSDGGMGIGLTLVKRLVEMHGGRVEAHSDGIGKGSRVSVRLPIVVEASLGVWAEEPPPPRPAPKASLRILVVDDNHDSASTLAMMLQIVGHQVRTGGDGAEGIELAEKFRPDVILLDLGMPKLNGYETCEAIRGKPWSASTIIIAMTGWGQEDDRRRTRAAGFDHHFVKPVDPAALIDLLAKLETVKA